MKTKTISIILLGILLSSNLIGQDFQNNNERYIQKKDRYIMLKNRLLDRIENRYLQLNKIKDCVMKSNDIKEIRDCKPKRNHPMHEQRKER